MAGSRAREGPASPGPAAALGSAGLLGLATGEQSDEGHGPDATARAGAGNRGRPSQGRRRPSAGTGAWGAAGRVPIPRPSRQLGCTLCEPGHGQTARLGKEPTCPSSQLSK